MIYPLSVRRENDLIRRELGMDKGHQRYQWAWSEEMTMPMVVIDAETGAVEYDYICACGVNRQVHSPECRSLSVPRPKVEVRSTVPTLRNQWVFARWIAPELSREKWQAVFNIPYPEGGYLIPVGDLMQCLALHPGETPKRTTTEIMIAAVREHFSKTALQRHRETLEDWDKRDRDKREELRLQIKDVAPVHMGFPGEKNDWCAGGDVSIESPTLRKKSETTLIQ